MSGRFAAANLPSSATANESCRSEGSDGSPGGSRFSQQERQSSFGSRLSSIGGSFGKGSKKGTPRAERKDRSRTVTVPSAVAARLSAFRAKRRENDAREITLSNLLSVAAVKNAMNLNDDGLAAVRERSGPQSPSRLQRKASRAAQTDAAAGGAVSGMNAIRDLVDDTRDLAAELVRRIPSALFAGYDPEAPEPRGNITFVTPEVNRKIRKQLLKQNWFTNRFQGSAEAARAEDEFARYSSRYHIARVRQRLLVTSIFLLFSLVEPLAAGMASASELGPYLALKTVGPVLSLALGSLMCLLRRTRPFWRAHVVWSALVAYNCILWSDSVIDVSGWSRAAQDYSTVLQCVWQIIASQYFALTFALDFMHNLALVALLWASFVVGVTTQVFRWREVSAYYAAYLAGMARQDAAGSPDGGIAANNVIQSEPAVLPSAHAGGGDGGASLQLLSCETFLAANVSGSERLRMDGGWILSEVLLFSGLASLLLVLSVHRQNRFERQSFINSFVLLNKTVIEEKKKRGESRELLALFSNPAAPQQLQLRPLQLGQELKFLLRSVPPGALMCEPAAALTDVEAAIQRCDPSLLLFSGHSFAGSLAFELPNGRIELPPPGMSLERHRSPSTCVPLCV